MAKVKIMTSQQWRWQWASERSDRVRPVQVKLHSLRVRETGEARQRPGGGILVPSKSDPSLLGSYWPLISDTWRKDSPQFLTPWILNPRVTPPSTDQKILSSPTASPCYFPNASHTENDPPPDVAPAGTYPYPALSKTTTTTTTITKDRYIKPKNQKSYSLNASRQVASHQM